MGFSLRRIWIELRAAGDGIRPGRVEEGRAPRRARPQAEARPARGGLDRELHRATTEQLLEVERRSCWVATGGVPTWDRSSRPSLEMPKKAGGLLDED